VTDAGPDGQPPVARADLRLAAPAVAAWASAAFALGLPAQSGLLAAGALVAAGLVALRLRSRHVVVVLLVAGAASALAALRVAGVAAGPVRDLAAARAEVHAVLVATSDARRHRGRFGPYVVLRARVDEIVGRGVTTAVRTPVLVIGPGSWTGVRLGEWLRARGRLDTEEGPDVAAVLVAQGSPAVLSEPAPLARALGSLRRGLRRSVQDLGPVERVLVPALVDGDDAGMPGYAVAEFRTCGLTHLLAVSGANLTLVLGFLLVAARWSGVRAWGLSLVGAVGIAGFVLLARPEPSVLRAAAMGVVALVGLGAADRRRGARALTLAVLVLVLVDPWLARSVGFLLSAMATAGILALAPSWRDAMARWLPRWLAEALAVPMAAQVVCTPVIAAISGQVSLVAMVANLAAAPAVAPATVLGLLACLAAPLSSALAAGFGHLAGVAAWWIALVAKRCAALPGASLPWPAGVLSVTVLAGLCIALVVVTPKVLGRRGRCLAVAALLGIVLVRPPTTLGWPPAHWALVACDVGQGDALVLPAGEHTAVVFDTGPDPKLVDGCLDRLGISAVPLVVLTHLHADHVDGLPGVLRGRRVGEVEIGPLDSPPEQLDSVIRWTSSAGVPLTRVTYGERRRVAGLAWTVIGPVPGLAASLSTGEEGSPPNNASIVVKVREAGVSLLLTGDVEPPAQQALLRSGVDLRADVLKVPHHGSRYQDPRFVAAVGARLAIISVGADNDYGHPAPETLSLLHRLGAQVRRTDRDGDIAVVATPEGLSVATR
jgi:competence protein ComEC